LKSVYDIEDNDNEIRIIAAVPDVDAGHLTVDVLPGSIVVEAEAATSPVERYSVFPFARPDQIRRGEG
jgi:HSP20 family molecular chaperone IbpA